MHENEVLEKILYFNHIRDQMVVSNVNIYSSLWLNKN